MRQLLKQSIKSMLRMRGNIIILFLLVCLTSFMYFFVQCSIDANIAKLYQLQSAGIALTGNQKDYLIALESNTILARSLLLGLAAIAGFVFYMFFKRYFSGHKRELGLYKALGYTDGSICLLFCIFTFLLSMAGSWVGLLFGWAESDVLLRANETAYTVENIKKGIHMESIFSGTMALSLVLCLATLLACRQFFGKESALLINGSERQNENRIIVGISQWVANLVPGKHQFATRMVIRKPVTILLNILAVGIFSTLFILSLSLNLSSQEIFSSQTNGHNYQYETIFQEIETGGADQDDRSYYLSMPVGIETQNSGRIERKLVGLDQTEKLLILKNKKGVQIKIPDEDGAVIGPELKEVYGISVGEPIDLMIGGQKRTVIVTNIAQNAGSKTLYISKTKLSQWLGISEDSYNGVYSMSALSQTEHALSQIEQYEDSAISVISQEQRMEKLKRDAVSNRISAVINQVLGCVVGCILIYLSLLLNFQDSTKNILTLSLLGYQPKEINQMLIDIYGPVLWISFAIMLLPGILITKSIQIGLSIETGDYMPFKTNILIITAMFVVINIIYFLAKTLFQIKIRKIVREEEIAEFLS